MFKCYCMQFELLTLYKLNIYIYKFTTFNIIFFLFKKKIKKNWYRFFIDVNKYTPPTIYIYIYLYLYIYIHIPPIMYIYLQNN